MLQNNIRNFLFGTLRRQLIFGVALTYTILISLFLFDLTQRQEAMFLERQNEHAIALTQSLALSSAGWLAANDIAGLQELVDSQKRYPELLYSILTNSEGRILAHNDRQKVGLTLLDLPNTAKEKIFRSDHELIDIAVPVMLAGKHVGWSRVGVGQNIANQKLNQIIREGIIYALIAILLGTLIAWVLASKMTKRLNAIQRVMLDVKTGNNQTRIHLDGNDEATVLAQEFNGMLDVVAQREQDLNKSKEQLEERVKERTADIARSTDALREQAELLNLTHDSIIVRTMDNVITYWNNGAASQYGWQAEEVVGKVKTHDLLHTIFPIPLDEIYAYLLRNNRWEGELTHTKRDGSKLTVFSRWVLQRNGDNEPVAIMEVNNDITDRKQMEGALRESEERFRNILENAPIGMSVLSLEGRFTLVNRSLCEIVGYSKEELEKLTFQDITHPEDLETSLANVQQLLDGSIKNYNMEKRYIRKDSRLVWIQLTVSIIRDTAGVPQYFVAQIEDITARRQSQEQIRQLAFYDALTSLPNRRLLVDRLNQALTQAKRYKRSLALMFLDLDNFKQVNDTFGHDIGDELLKVVSSRLQDCVRGIDTVCRQGGDEFIVVLSEIAHPEDAAVVANKIITSISKPFSLHEEEMRITTSIGIAVYPVDGTDNYSILMKKADKAMYDSKQNGGNGFTFYSEFTSTDIA